LCLKYNIKFLFHFNIIRCKLRTIELTSYLRKYAVFKFVPRCVGIKSVDSVAKQSIEQNI
jgi:hypothetical protein